MTQMARPDDAPAAFQAAWNAHDMIAFGALFHKDATFVNRFAHLVAVLTRSSPSIAASMRRSTGIRLSKMN
jgi:hypothetical protein